MGNQGSKLARLFRYLSGMELEPSPLPADSVSSQEQSPTRTKVRPRIGKTRRYLDNGDGTVTDPETNLRWMRCSLGQTWNGTDCVGNANEYTWEEAAAAAAALNERGGYAGFRDWRVPWIDGLHSLVYCSSGNPGIFPFQQGGYIFGNHWCRGNHQKPTIDLEAFPNTPPSGFWSNQPTQFDHVDFHYPTFESDPNAWYVCFYSGSADLSRRNDYRQVRLVRRGE